ncbi:hypothetical protein BDP81DRAFT_439657 [Colletotrichum phormii]|uniref:Uncharacterized protein n=1 Tax=Colletotrichum phormii TaxID=359342 RepID=A0AAI9ZFA8_9PEZI|nr:uncharacterized protein BDP81DRAFT_439657 [Colletotrichum phormii]KAK1623480.1 hypothetical protein BDP81DRAFT_439657 [Colletotrichum phormii]
MAGICYVASVALHDLAHSSPHQPHAPLTRSTSSATPQLALPTAARTAYLHYDADANH